MQRKQSLPPIPLLLLPALLALGGCSWTGPIHPNGDPPMISESDHDSNYHRIFGAARPADLTIAHSALIDYENTGSVGATPDWVFEMFASPAWIEETKKECYLRIGDRAWAAQRPEAGFRDWFKPEPIEDYEAYYSYVTSIPYIRMLVRRAPEPDGRHRVFISKY